MSDKIQVSKVLKRLRELVNVLIKSSSDVDKAMLYAGTKIIINYLSEVKDESVPELLLEEYLGELEGHLLVLAGYTSYGRSMTLEQKWALGVINKLESGCCFGHLIAEEK